MQAAVAREEGVVSSSAVEVIADVLYANRYRLGRVDLDMAGPREPTYFNVAAEIAARLSDVEACAADLRGLHRNQLVASDGSLWRQTGAVCGFNPGHPSTCCYELLGEPIPQPCARTLDLLEPETYGLLDVLTRRWRKRRNR